MKLVELVTSYEVASSNVRLDVVIGDAQIGSSVVKLDNKKLSEGDIANLIVGPGPKIKGKSLLIKSVVADVNDNTNRTSVTYQLRGGVADQKFLSSATVDADGDSVVYRAKIRLV